MSPDGKQAFKVEKVGPADECEVLGKAAGNQIRKEAGETFFEEMQEYVQAVAAANTKPAKTST
jgi:porphobilinogen deaminase